MFSCGLREVQVKRLLVLASLLLCSTGTLHAQTVFTEDFESFPTATITSPSSFGAWSVTAGSVDTLSSFPGLTCHGGTHCVDMDGSTGAAGTIQRTFAATAGVQYVLGFWYSGNQRGGSDSMTVSLGTSTLSLTNIPSSQPYTQGTVSWIAPSTGTATVQFAHAGADNVGILLDDVTLTAATLTPIPTPTLSQWATIGLAVLLLAFGAFRLKSNTAV
jgi:hypothetical protein